MYSGNTTFHPFELSKDDTLKAKGIAAVLLLWHHLFYTHPEMPYIVYRSACWAKVCVHLFLFLSGYGLFYTYLSISKTTNDEFHALWQFYKGRFLKLMPRYWIVFFLCVPICILVFKQFPADVFPGTHPWLRLTMQFCGVHMLAQPASYGYNPTWWFMTLILLLYLIFPFLFLCVNNLPIASLVLFTLGCYSDFFFMPVIEYWLIPFVIGIAFARLSFIDVKPLLISQKKIAIIVIFSILFITSISFPINHFGIFIASFQVVVILNWRINTFWGLGGEFWHQV